MNKSLMPTLHQLWHQLSSRRRKQFSLLLVLMLLVSFAEILSIGAILPFLMILTSPEQIFEHSAARPIIRLLGLVSSTQLILPITILFSLTALIACSLRLLLLWAGARLSFATGADLGSNAYRRTLYQSYATHCGRNSSEVINGISSKINIVIYNIVAPILMFITSIFILLVALITFLILDPIIALASFGCFALIYGAIVLSTKGRLIANSRIISYQSDQVLKSIQEGLGGIRDIIIDGSQPIFYQIFRDADLVQRRAQARNHFIGQCPRYVVETLCMLFVAALAYLLTQESGGLVKAIPAIGALALGAQRLLPVLQQAYGSWAQIKGNQYALLDTLKLLNQPLPNFATQSPVQPLEFKSTISFKQLDFRYNQQTPYILKQVNLNIEKGSRIGFIGTTGSGKTTMLDIVMGLLEPTNGSLEIDGIPVTSSNLPAWQSHIAHVPQTIYLIDSTVEENIAFGVPKHKIDPKRVRQAAQQAQIADSIEDWPKQYQTLVGERGARLSGGQRQRIGIARALYKEADVIIFDEATSALDSQTEQAVMQAIENLDKDLTILVIAHRLTTLKFCTQIVELTGGIIKQAEMPTRRQR